MLHKRREIGSGKTGREGEGEGHASSSFCLGVVTHSHCENLMLICYRASF